MVEASKSAIVEVGKAIVERSAIVPSAQILKAVSPYHGSNIRASVGFKSRISSLDPQRHGFHSGH